MLKRAITYTNPFTEQEVTEEHYFHISKADLVEMEMEEHKDEYTDKSGQKLTGMQAKLTRIGESEDGKAIVTTFKDIIRRAYGKKDGDRFLKSQAIWEEFESSEAFSQLLFEICTDANGAAEFINAVIPKGLSEEAAKIVAAQSADISDAEETPAQDKVANALATESETAEEGPRLLTTAEAAAMSPEELQSGLVNGRYKLS